MAEEQAKENPPADIFCLEYTLSPVPPERYFEPISWCATKEVGKSGPLDTEQLRDFLENVYYGQATDILSLVKQYTRDVRGIFIQLRRLRLRIMDIETLEKDITDYVIKRIKGIMKDLENERSSSVLHHRIPFSKTVDVALTYIGSQRQALLNKDELLDFIHTGNCNKGSLEEKINLLDQVLNRIISEVHREKSDLSLPLGRIQKALEGIFAENIEKVDYIKLPCTIL